MPLQPGIALAGRGIDIQPPDLLRTMLVTAQLREQQNQQQLRDLQLLELLRRRQQGQALQAYVGSLVQPQPTTAPAVSPLNPQEAAGAIVQAPLGAPAPPTTPAAVPPLPGQRFDPLKAIQIGGMEALPLAQAMRQGEHDDLARQTLQLKQMDAGIDFMTRALGVIGDQSSLDATRAELAKASPYLAQMLPQTYDQGTIEGLLRRMHLAKQRSQQLQTGFTPIYGTQGGQTTFVLPTNQGTVVQPNLPPGFQVAPQAQALNLGTSQLMIDRRTGQPMTQYPIDVRGEATQKAVGQETGKAMGEWPQTARKIEEQLASLEQKQAVGIQDIDRAMALIESSTLLPTTGIMGNFLKAFYQPGKDLEGLLKPVRSQTGYDELTTMRQTSPTGAAVGNVSDFETKELQSLRGNIEQSQSKPQLLANLQRLKDFMLEMKQRRRQAFAEDKVRFGGGGRPESAGSPGSTAGQPYVPQSSTSTITIRGERAQRLLRNLPHGLTREQAIEQWRQQGIEVIP